MSSVIITCPATGEPCVSSGCGMQTCMKTRVTNDFSLKSNGWLYVGTTRKDDFELFIKGGFDFDGSPDWQRCEILKIEVIFGVRKIQVHDGGYPDEHDKYRSYYNRLVQETIAVVRKLSGVVRTFPIRYIVLDENHEL